MKAGRTEIKFTTHKIEGVATEKATMCRFEGTLEPGECRFVLYSRNGLPSSSSVMPSSRKVILRG